MSIDVTLEDKYRELSLAYSETMDQAASLREKLRLANAKNYELAVIRHELTKVIKSLECELYQQRFNNDKNLSIDQRVADALGFYKCFHDVLKRTMSNEYYMDTLEQLKSY